jgi:hypothetical protein
VAFNIGKSDATFLDYLAIGKGASDTAPTLRSLPWIFFKTSDAVDGLQLRAEAILEVEQIAADRFWIHSAI